MSNWVGLVQMFPTISTPPPGMDRLITAIIPGLLPASPVAGIPRPVSRPMRSFPSSAATTLEFANSSLRMAECKQFPYRRRWMSWADWLSGTTARRYLIIDSTFAASLCDTCLTSERPEKQPKAQFAHLAKLTEISYIRLFKFPFLFHSMLLSPLGEIDLTR